MPVGALSLLATALMTEQSGANHGHDSKGASHSNTQPSVQFWRHDREHNDLFFFDIGISGVEVGERKGNTLDLEKVLAGYKRRNPVNLETGCAASGDILII